MLVASDLEELGVFAAVLGDLLPGEGRLLEEDLLPDGDEPLPKDKMGEESRDRFGIWEGDATDVFTVGVVGELIPVLLGTWAEEVDPFGTVLGKVSLPLVVGMDGHGLFGGESGEPGQLQGEAEDVGETEGPVFHICRPVGMRADTAGERPLSQFFMSGVLSPVSSSLSTVDWRLGMLDVDFEVTKPCGCPEACISKLSSFRAV